MLLPGETAGIPGISGKGFRAIGRNTGLNLSISGDEGKSLEGDFGGGDL